MKLLDLLLSSTTSFLQMVGNRSKTKTCTVLYDEPEVPKELIQELEK
ncbi:cyclic lactone autoinducer peptide AgrD [Staphylococcus auricularis]|uniref:AgrD n=1 Tax=Staphylococcus auricularis TaxID=29379 RepID=Q8VT06_9STAP|nr:cyclic lactone autoinducer peptide [Staphylococcus auricularis]AAL65809.1 AgrD [Staphylococcus auricularis]MCE5039079.1 cyclic lactone autoinducer peptide [Staphylococcus auricularis]MEB6570917.1 cyclic lactone autoinducer peptide [Staphylococcus auricularis]PTH15570.1 cyclic lactone autoinducer peptide [Staphylococcus auricularis]PTH25562.1 cyclic lactone autoinducer peptide [Staphylococcus auricularis]